jgi:hypothetical protein
MLTIRSREGTASGRTQKHGTKPQPQPQPQRLAHLTLPSEINIQVRSLPLATRSSFRYFVSAFFSFFHPVLLLSYFSFPIFCYFPFIYHLFLSFSIYWFSFFFLPLYFFHLVSYCFFSLCLTFHFLSHPYPFLRLSFASDFPCFSFIPFVVHFFCFFFHISNISSSI